MWAGNGYLSALDILFYGLCFVELTPINYQISISRNPNNHIKNVNTRIIIPSSSQVDAVTRKLIVLLSY